MNTPMVFKPRPSTGWAWVSLIGLLLVGFGAGLGIRFGFGGVFLITILIALLIGAGFLLLAVFLPRMRYEIGDTCLSIRYGPILRYTVNLADIREIRQRDLTPGMVSSFRFPGLALFGVPYMKVGTVKMCATASSKGILLIETGSSKYGITPADESAFTGELRKRMGK